MEEILASIRRIISDEVAGEVSGARRAHDTAANESASNMGLLRVEPETELVSAEVASLEVGLAAMGGNRRSVSAWRRDRGEIETRAFSDVRPAQRAHPSEGRAAILPNAYPSFAPLGRGPALDPFTARPRDVSRISGESDISRDDGSDLVSNSLADPATLDKDADQSFRGPDFALVEQAVQAELASVVSHEPVGNEVSAAEFPLDVGFPNVPGHADQDLNTADEPLTTETAEMQVSAKPSPRPTEVTEERRSPEAQRTDGPVLPLRPEPRLATLSRAGAMDNGGESRDRLVSGVTNSAVSASFGSLARTVAANSRTVDDLVTEALRPMLKTWLDENLPALVERLVRAEIERVSRQSQ